MTAFLLSAFDGHVESAHRLDSAGKAILKFEAKTVWRLIDHARNAPDHIRSEDDESGITAALWLVGDAGIYLMSNGRPPILIDGKIVSVEDAHLRQRLCAYAEGCDPTNDWWPIHLAIEEGNDFSRTLPVDFIISALTESTSYIYIVASSGSTQIYSDSDWTDRNQTRTRLLQ